MNTSSIESVMKEAGANSYPNEACGLVISVGKKTRAIQTVNASEFPRNQFLIPAEEYARVADMGEVIGIWHTHCEISQAPSEADLAGCEATELPWYIISVRKSDEGFVFSDIEVVTPSGFQMDYLGRPYIYGIFDCYSLVQDYYKREYNISLFNYSRIVDWWKKGHNFFEGSYKAEGFVSLIDEEPVVGDVFLIQSDSKVANHMAVYIGDDMIIHQLHGRLSKRDVYGGYWKKHTVFHLRHVTKC